MHIYYMHMYTYIHIIYTYIHINLVLFKLTKMFLTVFGYDNNHGMLSNVIASYMANNTFSHRQDVAFATVTAIR